MDTFDEVEFVKNLDPGKLVGARITKDQWKYIARTFKIGYSHADSKKELRQSVLSSLVSTNMLPEQTNHRFLAPQFFRFLEGIIQLRKGF